MTTRLSLVQKVSQVGATEFTVEVFLLDAVSVGSYQLEIEVLGLSSGVRYRYQSAGLVGMMVDESPGAGAIAGISSAGVTFDANGLLIGTATINFDRAPTSAFSIGPQAVELLYTSGDAMPYETVTSIASVTVATPVASIVLASNITADDVINVAEAAGTVLVAGTVGGDVKAGDTVALTVNSKSFTGLVSGNATALAFSIAVPGSDLAADTNQTVVASVTTSNLAGKTATATDTESYEVAVVAPRATVALAANITADDVLNVVEAAGSVMVAGTVGGDVKVGDTVNLTVNGHVYTGAVAPGRSFGIAVLGSDLVADTDKQVDASVTTTDAAGNSANATGVEAYTVDTLAPTASIGLVADIAADGVVNMTEAAGSVVVTGSVGGDARSGDTVKLTVNGKIFPGAVSAEKSFGIAVPGAYLLADADGKVDASVTTTDAAGNSTTATTVQAYAVDIAAPVASVVLTPNITADDVVNAQEAVGTVAVTGTVGGDVKAGDTVTLTINGKAFAGVVSSLKSFSIGVSGSDLAADADGKVDASVTTSDAAGNSATATGAEAYSVDTVAPLASLELTPNITTDDVNNTQEAAGTVAVTGTVGGDVKVGDTITLTVNGKAFTGLVAQDKSFSIIVGGSDLVADADKRVDASVTTVDAAGNSATASSAQGYSVNHAPTGNLTISGVAIQGQTLLGVNTLADADGLGTVSYQWLADGSAISGANDVSGVNGDRLVLAEAQVGKVISLSASYTDGLGQAESVASAATGAVGNLNDAGLISISGRPTQGQTLLATVADADGLGPISYQWLMDGVALSGATTARYLMLDAQVGHAMSVTARYTDGHGTAETVTGNFGMSADLLAYSWREHSLLEGVLVTTTNGLTRTTGLDGSAALPDLSSASMPITARLAVGDAQADAASHAVNLQDAIAILKMIVGLEVNGPGRPLSPYQSFAADFDSNGKVELSDAIAVLKHVVGLPSPDLQWLFFNEADGLAGKASLSPGVVPVLSLSLGNAATVHIGLVGALRGDVDGSYGGGALSLDVAHPEYLAHLAIDAGLSLSQFGVYP